MRVFPMSPCRPRSVQGVSCSVDRRVAQIPLAALALALVTVGAHAQAAAQTGAPHDASLDVRDARGLTQLIVAAFAGQTATVKSLLVQGAGVDATAADGRTALIAAAQSGKIEAVEVLVAAGANLEWSSRGTGTALNVAENSGQTQIAALLLQSGAHSTGKSVGDTVCVRPWGGDGFCGTVKSFTVKSVQIQITKIVGCAGGCQAREECSAAKMVGGNIGAQAGDQIAVPSWCLTHTGVKP
jgi:Ankyrin repeats (3 copies)